MKARMESRTLGAELQRLAGGADKFAEDGDVGAVHTDAAGVDGQTQGFGEIEINSSVIQFRKAIALCRCHTIEARGINGARRTMTAPGTAGQFVKLPPIAFLPSRHSYKHLRAVLGCVVRLRRKFAFFVFTARSQHWMPGFPKRFLQTHTANIVRSQEFNDSASATILQKP